jgi:hypothetical protein
VKAMGIKQVSSAPRSAWRRAYEERVIDTIRRECLDHMLIQFPRTTVTSILKSPAGSWPSPNPNYIPPSAISFKIAATTSGLRKLRVPTEAKAAKPILAHLIRGRIGLLLGALRLHSLVRCIEWKI